MYYVSAICHYSYKAGAQVLQVMIFIWLATFLTTLIEIYQERNSYIYQQFTTKLPNNIFTFSYGKLIK